MWFQKLGRDGMRYGALRFAGGGMLALAVACAGCVPDYVTNSTATVNLIVAAITNAKGGSVIDSDIRSGENSSFVCPDYATVAVAVRNKNLAAPVPSVPSAVILDSYEVRYFRTDGRGVEGVDVPYRITGNLTLAVDVTAGETTALPIEVVRRQAKDEPPLTTIFQTSMLTVMAQITVYGQTVSGQRVSDSGRIQIDFADFLDKLTGCETQ